VRIKIEAHQGTVSASAGLVRKKGTGGDLGQTLVFCRRGLSDTLQGVLKGPTVRAGFCTRTLIARDRRSAWTGRLMLPLCIDYELRRLISRKPLLL
jgi:hypothetical protein